MQRYDSDAIRDDLTVNPQYQTPAPGIQFWVKNLNGDPVVIYETNDTSGAQKPSPYLTGSDGNFFFYAPNGRYTIEFATGDERPDILLHDRFDELHASTGNTTNTVNGVGALSSNASGSQNTASGFNSLTSNSVGNYNTGYGLTSLLLNVDGSFNTSIGVDSLRFKTDGSGNTSFSNCSGFGNDSRVSGSNQVQLGNSGTTTYVYGTVQNRSDIRDKAEVRKSTLGLDFINALRPVDYKWNMREDYQRAVTESIKNPEFTSGSDKPESIKVNKVVYDENDGSKTRNRFHHGLIAQDVQKLIKETGVDFGGFQDHSLSDGGCDVLSIGYDELITPLINAFQQYQSATNKEIEALKLEIEKLKV